MKKLSVAILCATSSSLSASSLQQPKGPQDRDVQQLFRKKPGQQCQFDRVPAGWIARSWMAIRQSALYHFSYSIRWASGVLMLLLHRLLGALHPEPTAPFCIAGVLAAELPGLPREVGVAVRGHFSDLSRWLEHVLTLGVKQGSMRLENTPTIEAQNFLAAVYGAMLAARAFDDPGKFSAIVDAFVRRIRVESRPHARRKGSHDGNKALEKARKRAKEQ